MSLESGFSVMLWERRREVGRVVNKESEGIVGMCIPLVTSGPMNPPTTR